MDKLDLATVREIIDFSGGNPSLADLGDLQLKGAVAIHNMIADSDVGLGYLADEVGMGKTYVALGVVALMRYFNPSLRVLYICPSRNVQEKWGREYNSFIKDNIKKNQYRIRTIEGKPAAPFINCRNVAEIIRMASLGYYADFFVGKDSFSIALSDDKLFLEKKLNEIKSLLPAHEWDGIIEVKSEVKEQYAKALNYILPTFDLVVIDEAHNFKHDFESSDRNRVLSRVLGYSNELGYQKRIKNALLLSATPYDRDIGQLYNQLNLVGKSTLLEGVKNDQKLVIVEKLKCFMVRRLNELTINDIAHTRNMYRKEHRSGGKAEITLATDEQKLVTALVQKKVGEMMGGKDSSPSYQVGMMASFESYAQTSKIEPIQFDGDEADKVQSDAKDRHVIAHIVESYKDADLGTTLPHPKMDAVCHDLSEALFANGKKQIVFVRRVRSVGEIKTKLDDHYNQWLEKYIATQLADYPDIKHIFMLVFEEYKKQSRRKDSDISEGEFKEGEEGDTEDSQPPKNDTFFAWFFRGAIEKQVIGMLSIDNVNLTTPDLVRRALTSKNQVISLLMELNWAKFICSEEGHDLGQILKEFSVEIKRKASYYRLNTEDLDQVDIYSACQLGFISWYGSYYETERFEPLIKFLFPHTERQNPVDIKGDSLHKNLQLETFYTVLHDTKLAEDLFPLQGAVLQALKASCDNHENRRAIELLLNKLDIHCHLISLCLRTGHGIIDLYLSRLKQGIANLTDESRNSWLLEIVRCLKEQSKKSDFSTYHELSNLAGHLDLIIKTNIPEIFDEPLEARRKFISHRLNPVSPIIGATGETSNIRSAQARKFRMAGYPLALISTDVFQEGEDLHTFCDSVMHYGLSGSPVGIEQKTGRVDRVNSLVQRRLLNYKNELIDENDLIQVVFPHVKESIEVLQVRQLCRNINEFIESLHEIGNQPHKTLDIVDIEQELLNKELIAAQIGVFLKSPYVSEVKEKLENSKYQLIGEQRAFYEAMTLHVKALIERTCSEAIFDEGYVVLNNSSNNNQLKLLLKIKSSRRMGVLILDANVEKKEYRLSSNNIQELMLHNLKHNLCRVQAEEISHGCYRLYDNCEMLIGDENLTQEQDINHFFERFKEGSQHNLELTDPKNQKINDYWAKSCVETLIVNNIDLAVKFEGFKSDDALGIKVIGSGEFIRSHNVLIYESGEHCVFTAIAVLRETSDTKLGKLSGEKKDKKIIEYTWERNKHIDVVDFYIDAAGNIGGRVIHPIESLDWEEFIFCIYILGVEADRLEYIFSQDDIL